MQTKKSFKKDNKAFLSFQTKLALQYFAQRIQQPIPKLQILIYFSKFEFVVCFQKKKIKKVPIYFAEPQFVPCFIATKTFLNCEYSRFVVLELVADPGDTYVKFKQTNY